jgi:glycosyltransferase involved in cell wall biosynthesis
MILEGYIQSGKKYPFVVVGNTTTKYGRMLKEKYDHPMICFTEGIYDKNVLECLISHARLYFHGHSVGGTNPSLLEAMATGVALAVHDNPFNAHVVNGQAAYFRNAEDVTRLIAAGIDPIAGAMRSRLNKEAIGSVFSWKNITNAYEELFLEVFKAGSRQPAASGIRTYGEINAIEPATTYP